MPKLDAHLARSFRGTRRNFSVEDEIRIVLEGLRGEESIAELCRREGIARILGRGNGWSEKAENGEKLARNSQLTGRTKPMNATFIRVASLANAANHLAAESRHLANAAPDIEHCR